MIDINLNKELMTSFISKIEKIEADEYSFMPNKHRYGIDGSTFRAFRHIDTPSQKYRKRAALCTAELDSETFKSINSQDEFDKWHLKFSQAFNDAFGNELSFSQKMKLTDLYFKWAYQNEMINSPARNVIHRFGYCALDSVILKQMNACFNNMLPLCDKISMGDIKEHTTYQFCQRLIDLIVRECNTTRIIFDIWAWEYRTL